MTQIAFPVHPAWKLGSTGQPGPMLAHQRMPWKPVVLPPNPNLGQVGEGTVKTMAIGALLLPTVAAAAVSFVGFRLGSKDDGWESILGYIVGALGGLSALMGVLAMLGVAVTPFNITPKIGPQEVSVPTTV